MLRGRHGAMASVLLGTLVVGACQQFTSPYLDRTDKIDFGAGNAVEANAVAQMIDPWPAHARNKNIATSGAVIARAVKRYRCGTTEIPPSTLTQTTGTSSGNQSSSTSVATPQPGGTVTDDC
jgi:hypothetical protein